MNRKIEGLNPSLSAYRFTEHSIEYDTTYKECSNMLHSSKDSLLESNMRKKNCILCGNKTNPSNSSAKYCSHECFIEHKFPNRNKIGIQTVTCLNCGKVETYKEREGRKFCSKSCSATYHNFGRDRYEKKRGYKLKRVGCLRCGNPTKAHAKKFCSRDCFFLFQKEDYIHKWLSGEKSGTTGIKFKGISLTIRKYLFEKFDNSCQECGWGRKNETTGTIPLAIHHVDGNYLNNRPENLELLCPNCHSLTPNYCGANAGKSKNKRPGGGREDHWKSRIK